MKNRILSTKNLSKISILAVLSAILLFINFPLFFFPSFYKIDFAELPRLLCGFAIGPSAGVICTVLSIIINIVMEGGSETAFVGEFAALVISITFILPASIYYRKNHTRRGAIISLIIGSLIASFVSVFINYYVLIPMYEYMMNIPLQVIIQSASKIIPFVNSKLSLVILCTFPFNLFKAIVNSMVIIIIYKRISPLLKDKSL